MGEVAMLVLDNDSIVLCRPDKGEMIDDNKRICWIVNDKEDDQEDSFIFYEDEKKTSVAFTLKRNNLEEDGVRDIHMKNAKGDVVATINFLTSEEGKKGGAYVVRIAKGMDAVF